MLSPCAAGANRSSLNRPPPLPQLIRRHHFSCAPVHPPGGSGRTERHTTGLPHLVHAQLARRFTRRPGLIQADSAESDSDVRGDVFTGLVVMVPWPPIQPLCYLERCTAGAILLPVSVLIARGKSGSGGSCHVQKILVQPACGWSYLPHYRRSARRRWHTPTDTLPHLEDRPVRSSRRSASR